MKTWYRGVCEIHREARTIMVSNPSCSAHYLGNQDAEIQAWLEKHSGCRLILAHSDDDFDWIYANGFAILDSPIEAYRVHRTCALCKNSGTRVEERKAWSYCSCALGTFLNRHSKKNEG